MKATLIISVYKDAESLTAVLKSVVNQSVKDFEVIISQDCETDCFDELIKEFSSKLTISHLQQLDNGFLKNRLLNKAILMAKSDKLVFIDGDCLLHPKFMEQYIKHLAPNRMCFGRRIDLDKDTTAKIKEGSLLIPSFFGMIRNKSTRVEERFFLPLSRSTKVKCLGCNMGWHRSDLIKLNGFDEDYSYPGFGEDTDIEYRGHKAGLEVFSMRYKAIQFHLDHKRPNREDEVSHSKDLFMSKKSRADFRCANGIEKID